MIPSSSTGSATGPVSRGVYRIRLAVVCLGLVVLAFIQDPGRIAADTKLDLTANPWGFLGRALHLWDPQGFFGQVQNQAYGYLFPIGPFFGIMNSLHVPAWVAQRLWWSVILVVGFLGVVRLCRYLGISRPLARVIAGLAYVLSARFLTTLGPISGETWPAALMPWALVPLVSPTPRGPRSRGLRAAVPLLLTGAVNAVGTLTVLVLPALWLVTRQWNRDLVRLAAWWTAGVALATSWWLVPLFTLRLVSPAFLDWIESSATTTQATGVVSTMRGTTSWVAYLADANGPVWEAGWMLISVPVIVVAQVVLAGFGLLGILLWPGRERWFIGLGLLAGLILTGMGHVGAADGFGAQALQTMLDGLLAPLRNTHKFQPVVTLVLALGLGRSLQLALGWFHIGERRGGLRALLARWTGRRSAPATAPAAASVSAAAQPRTPSEAERPLATSSPDDVSDHRVALGWAALTAVCLGLVAVSAPAWSGALTRERSYVAIPDYWQETASWLADEGAAGRALVLPGAPFGDYVWGRSQDEPLQVLASTPWAVRDIVPLSSAGNIRLLDAVESRITAGRGSAGLTEALSRSGIRYVVMRNDLDPRATGAPRRALVAKALRTSPGMAVVARFGPEVRGYQAATTVDVDAQEPAFSAVEIWGVGANTEPDRALAELGVALRPVAGAATVAGGPEALLDLGDAELLQAAPLFASGDTPAELGALPTITTDSPRRTEVAFGLQRTNRSATMTADDEYVMKRRVHDYVVEGAETPLRVSSPTRQWSASASTARSEVTAPIEIDPGSRPEAAFDGDPDTAWRSQLGRAVGEHWQLDLARPVDLTGESLRIALVSDGTLGAVPTQLRIQTAGGSIDVPVKGGEGLQKVPAPAGTTDWVRIELLEVALGSFATSFGIREVQVPGVETDGVGDVLTVTGTAESADGPVVLTARTGERGGCVLVGTVQSCSPGLARTGEERTELRRLVDVPADATVRVRVQPRPGADLSALVDRTDEERATVTASSTSVLDPGGRPGVVLDRSEGTTWVAAPGDPDPTLTVKLPEQRTLTGLTFVTADEAPASDPFRLKVIANGDERELFTNNAGYVQLPDITTDELEIHFGFPAPRQQAVTASGLPTPWPVGVSELIIDGAGRTRYAVDDEDVVTVPCGQGPDIRIGSQEVRTRITTTKGALLDGQIVAAEACDQPEIDGGREIVSAKATSTFLVDQVSLLPPQSEESDSGAAQRPLAQPVVTDWDPTHRVVQIPEAASARVLELGENANTGWRATLGTDVLTPVRVDGWRQGWVVPAGASGDVTLVYEPDSGYRTGMLVGAFAAVLLLVLAGLPRTWLPGGPDLVALRAGRPRRPLRVVILTVGLGLLGGFVGIAAGLVVVLTRLGWRGRVIGLAICLALIGVISGTYPWPQAVPTPLVWVGVVAGLAGVALAIMPRTNRSR